MPVALTGFNLTIPKTRSELHKFRQLLPRSLRYGFDRFLTVGFGAIDTAEKIVWSGVLGPRTVSVHGSAVGNKGMTLEAMRSLEEKLGFNRFPHLKFTPKARQQDTRINKLIEANVAAGRRWYEGLEEVEKSKKRPRS